MTVESVVTSRHEMTLGDMLAWLQTIEPEHMGQRLMVSIHHDEHLPGVTPEIENVRLPVTGWQGDNETPDALAITADIPVVRKGERLPEHPVNGDFVFHEGASVFARPAPLATRLRYWDGQKWVPDPARM